MAQARVDTMPASQCGGRGEGGGCMGSSVQPCAASRRVWERIFATVRAGHRCSSAFEVVASSTSDQVCIMKSCWMSAVCKWQVARNKGRQALTPQGS